MRLLDPTRLTSTGSEHFQRPEKGTYWGMVVNFAMAHLGVLKALEQSGIVVDMIAGTSVGAMTGILNRCPTGRRGD
jgi:hypothetical protein